MGYHFGDYQSYRDIQPNFGGGGVIEKISFFGAYGVQLFFVISSYTIFLTYNAAISREAAPTVNFFIRRVLRIVPVYWAGIILYAMVYGQGSRGTLPGPQSWHYPIHMLLLNVWHPETSSSAVPGGWSISVEVMFYLSMPLWIRIIKSRRDALWMFLVSSAIGTSITLFVPHLSIFSGFSERDMELYIHRLPTNQLACFAAGAWLYFAIRDRLHENFVTRLKSGLLLLGAAFLFFGANRWIPIAPSKVHFFALAFAVAGLGLAGHQWSLAVNRLAEFMGRISYSAYLLHFLVLKQFASVCVPVPASTQYFVMMGAIGFAVTIPLAWLGHRYVERPASNWAKRIVAERERRLRRTAILAA